MIIEANGIKIDVRTDRNILVYQVLEQSKQATETLRMLTSIADPETGFTLRTNYRPSYNKKAKRFFLQGADPTKNNKRVKVTFDNAARATEAMQALQRMVNDVVMPEHTNYSHESDRRANGYVPGGTAHCRFQFINRGMAQKLQLTNCDLYPEEIPEWEATKPIFIKNDHANEHLSQLVDILNKSIENPKRYKGVINPHFATAEGSKKATELLRSCFQHAYEDGFLIEFWRGVTGLRSCDTIKRYDKKKYENFQVQPAAERRN